MKLTAIIIAASLVVSRSAFADQAPTKEGVAAVAGPQFSPYTSW